MLKLSNIRIPIRIAVACLLPLLAYTVLTGKELIDRRMIAADMDAIGVVAEAAPMIAGLVHELQKERGVSVGYIDSREQALADAMLKQRPLTDKSLESWNQRVAEYSKSYAGTKFAKNLDTAKSRLAGLGKMRAEIDASNTDSQKVMEEMVSAVAGLLNVVDAIDEMTENGRIIHQAKAMVALMRRKEYTAQGRGWGTIGFGAGQFVPQMYQAFMRSQNLADGYATIFTRSATQAQNEFVNGAMDTQARDSMNKMRQAAALSPYKGNAGNVPVAQWLQVTGAYIEGLLRAEQRLLSDFAATVRDAGSEARWGFWNLLTLFLGLLTVTGTVAWFVVLSITRPVGQLVETMATLAQGKNDIEVPGTDRGDEIGQMARAVLVFRDAAVEKNRLEAASVDQQKAAEVERQRNDAARAAAAAQVKHVVDALGAGLEQLARGALTYRITDEFDDEYKKVQSDFNEAIAQLQETVGAIVTSVREVSAAAGEISGSTSDLSQRTEEQAASLEETSAVSRRLRALKLNSFGQYREFLASDGREIENFINSISTNHTKFFREAHHFHHFRSHVVLPFAQSGGKNVGGRLRVWSAGCSSGEEPYTIAVVLKREIRDFGRCDVRILATDIDTDVLTRAARGEFTTNAFDEIPKPYHSFFTAEERKGTIDKVVMDKDVKSLITFRRLNLMQPWPFHGKFDAIFCRNVMIYFDAPTKTTLVDRFTQQLKPGGWLYIGHSESLIGSHTGLQLVGRTIYQRTA